MVIGMSDQCEYCESREAVEWSDQGKLQCGVCSPNIHRCENCGVSDQDEQLYGVRFVDDRELLCECCREKAVEDGRVSSYYEISAS